MTEAQALVLPHKRGDFTPAASTVPEAADDEVIVHVRAIAVNPMDRYMQTVGGLVAPWVRYPAVVGTDVAGEVVATGSGVTRFRVGDRVVGLAAGTDPKRNRSAEGAFQTHVVLLEHMAAAIPSAMDFAEAVVLPLGLSTAASALFQEDYLRLTRPTTTPQPTGETLVVWGGSTSVGCNAIQLAAAAGYEVITTCSPRNFERVARWGASAAFGYHDAHAVSAIVTALRGKRCAGAIAIGSGSTQACIDIVASSKGKKFVAVATPAATFDSVPLGRGRVRRLLSV